MKKKTVFLLFCVAGVSSLFAQNNYDLNKDGEVNSFDVVLLYNYIAYGTSTGITKDDLVGTWKVVYGEYTRLEDGTVVEEEKGNVEAENNCYVIYSDNKACFMEYSDGENRWHEDGTMVYTLYNGKVNVLGAFDYFKLSFPNPDEMVFDYAFTEDKAGVVVVKKNIEKMVRISKETDVLPLRP